MSNTLLIYGAAGFTGRLIARHAVDRGLDFEIAGRDQKSVSALADELGVGFRVFSLDNGDELGRGLEGIHCFLNCVAPMLGVAEDVALACIGAGVHYLDIGGEFPVYEHLAALGEKAQEAGVMLLPGVGLGVVAGDGLAVHVANRVDQPSSLRIAMKQPGTVSAGTVASYQNNLAVGPVVLSDGALVRLQEPIQRAFDFGEGAEPCALVSFGELISAPLSTGINTIEQFAWIDQSAGTGAGYMDKYAGSTETDRPALGPSADEIESGSTSLAAEVTGADGSVVRSVIQLPSGYKYTYLIAVECARRVLDGAVVPGYQSPSSALGADVAASVPGVKIIDI
jgi:short subunit dehydrogenase-like uncharacterized protein